MSVVPSTPVIITFVPAGSGDVAAADGQPSFAGELDVAGAAGATDEVERDHLLPDEPAVHAREWCGPWRACRAALIRGRTRTMPTTASSTAARTCDGDGAGSDEGDDRAGEAADGREQGVEGEVVQLDGEEHHAGSDPCDGQAAHPFCCEKVYDSDAEVSRRDRRVQPA